MTSGADTSVMSLFGHGMVATGAIGPSYIEPPNPMEPVRGAPASSKPHHSSAARDPRSRSALPALPRPRLMAAHKFHVGQTVQFRTKPYYVSAVSAPSK
jgi:hypothetical protein